MAMRVTEGLRSFERQKILYDQGRTAPGSIVTNAEPGHSFHTYGVAADCCFVGKDPYLENHNEKERLWSSYGQLCKEHGLLWGGDFLSIPDRPHCEIHYGGLAVSDLLRIYNVGGLDGVWKKFDLVLAGNPA